MENNNKIQPLVSVIMPAYNPDKELLSLAIKSIFNQTYSCIELIICDDGSYISVESYLKDVLAGLLNSNNINVIAVRNDTNLGISAARNKAIAQSSGKWLCWLDSDDTLQNDCIEELLKASDNFDLIIGECNVFEKNQVHRRKPKVYFESAKKYLKTEKDPFLLNIISLQPQLILKSEFVNIGNFDKNYRYAELTEIFLRYIVSKGLSKINFIETAVYNYNRNTENSLTSNRKKLFSQRLKALTSYLNNLGIDGKVIKYKRRNLESGMQEYTLECKNEKKKTSMREKEIGLGSFIEDKTIFKGSVSIGYYTVIGMEQNKEKKNCIIGDNVNIGSFVIIEHGVLIGDNVSIDHNCTIYSNAQIGHNSKILYGAKVFSNSIIGNHCIVGGNIPERMVLEDKVTFMGNVAHSYRNAGLDWDTTDEPSPIIGEGSVVGVSALIIGGIRIGKNCYISAGEILKHDLPDNSVFIKNSIYPVNFFKGLIKTR